MRIIAGTARGRQFDAPKGSSTRPTLDRVKESLFGSIQFDIPNSQVLDLFSGSGNLGLEAASRGARRVVCNDYDRACAALIKKNAASLGLSDRVEVLNLDYLQAIDELCRREERFDFAFIDAPYHKDMAQQAAYLLFDRGLMTQNGTVIVEHDSKLIPKECPPTLVIKRTRLYGSCGITYFTKEEPR